MQRTTEAICEELLARRCRRGEKAALEELIRTWEKRLFYFIRRLVDNETDAWDVLQQTWVRVLSGIGALRERYTQEIQAMLERKLGIYGKLFLTSVMCGSLAIAAYLGVQAVIHAELPPLARGAVFGAAWAVLCGRALRRGAWELRIQPAAMAALSWVFAVLLETCFLVLAPQFPDHFRAILALFSGLVILVGAGIILVNACVQQAELRTREALLRLEYRIAELSENRATAP